ncbi:MULTISPECIES: hypothetical protein [unclassified Thioalkalivibrio]|uniref:hypothetical protein n=1 Tax=unclassified Thioalkalivibrio TaxID=2621013 RepID=UPI000381C541|nr:MULTISPECIES: hypothetical protein [unclassified Thioalkalivibrio]
MKLNSVELPPDLEWEDEWAWEPYPEEAAHAIDGTHITERGMERQGGRPVTLSGAEDRAWADRPTLEALTALLHETSMTLELWDGRTLSVEWRHGDRPIETREILTGAGYWTLTLRLRTTE